MKVQSGTYQSLVAAEMRASTPVVETTSTPPAGSAVPVPQEIKAVEGPQTENKTDREGEKKDREAPQRLASRELVEVQGNPQATAANAAKVQRELSPPTNPYPSVQELATVRRAQAMERAARAELQEVEPEVVDRKV